MWVMSFVRIRPETWAEAVNKGNNWHKDPENIKEGKGGKKKNAEQKPRKAEKS